MCPYHQWTYDLDGRAVGVPFRRGVRGHGGMPDGVRPRRNTACEQLAVAERHGVVFASFADDVEPFDEYLGPTMLGYFDRVFDGRELDVLGYQRQRMPGELEADVREHQGPVPRQPAARVPRDVRPVPRRQPSRGARWTRPAATPCWSRSAASSRRTTATARDARRSASDFALRDPRLLDAGARVPRRGHRRDADDLAEPDRAAAVEHAGDAPDRHAIDAGAFELHWTFFGYADDDEEMRQRRLRQANLMGPAGLVSIDDSEVMRLAQHGASTAYPDAAARASRWAGSTSPTTEHMVTEAAIRAFYRHYWSVVGDQ